MEQLFEFLVNHWALSLALVVIVVLIIRMEMGWSFSSIPALTPSELVAKINRESAVVLDIRPQERFDDGHIVNSQHFVVAEMDKKIKKLNKFKSKPIVVVCEKGISCQKVAKDIAGQGFEDVYYLKSGITGWKDAQMPLSKN